MKLKRLLAVILLVVLLIGDSALAEDYQYYAKATADTQVYKSASTDSSKMGTLKKGTWVTMTQSGSDWAKITLNGKTGYCKLSKVKKSVKKVYVTAGTAVVYKKASSDSTKLTTLVFGAEVDAYYISGSYTHVVAGKNEGWVKSGALSLTNPNTLSQKVYIQAESGKVYAEPNTSSTSTTVSGTTALTCTAIYDGSWCRVKVNGKIGFVKKSSVGSSKYSAPAKASSSSSSSKSSSSSSKSTTGTGTYYVTAGYTYLYKSADSGSSKQGTLVYGDKVSVTETKSSYSKTSKGWVKTGALSSQNPNTMSQTVYAQSKSVKVYATPSTSASSTTVSYSQKMTCTAVYNETWCRVTLNGKVGFIQKKDLGTKKYDGYSTSSAASGKAKEMDWFKSGIQSIFYKGCVATVTDCKTGISWKVKRSGGYNHADVQPLTAADTAAMKKACGSDFGTWHRRPIWVSINGQKYAASMNCMPHGNGNITDNNFNGHHCIHFTNSRTHESNKVDPDHQATIKKALSY